MVVNYDLPVAKGATGIEQVRQSSLDLRHCAL